MMTTCRLPSANRLGQGEMIENQDHGCIHSGGQERPAFAPSTSGDKR